MQKHIPLLFGVSMSAIVATVYIVPSSSGGVLRAAELGVKPSDERIEVSIDGKPFASYLFVGGKDGDRPVVWPIVGPTGKESTRSWPIGKAKPGEATDHPHHRSLWFAHGDVDGIDFWAEGARCGKIVHRRLIKAEASDGTATIETENDWMDANGKKICVDVRTLRFGANDDARWIDFDIAITAGERAVTFRDTKEGAFAIRVPAAMSVNAKRGGKIVNSRGETDDDAWGKPAEWVDYHGPVEGETLGIAIFNHPSSFRFPTHWHVRTYGLFAANPFGELAFTGKGDGAHKLAKGETVSLRYRVYFHRGDEKKGRVARAYEGYAGE